MASNDFYNDPSQSYPMSPYTPSHTNSFNTTTSAAAPLLGQGTQPGIQTRVPSLNEDERERLSSNYSSGRQMLKLFSHMLARFIFSAVCSVAIVLVFKFYELKGVLDPGEKHIFNAIYIALSMILSMNLISAFKSLAGMIRWRLLAKHELTLREVDLILSLSSFQKTIVLLFTRTQRPGVPGSTKTKKLPFRLGAIAWTLLGVAAQVAIALIGLTYNHENSWALKGGSISITELKLVYPDALHVDYTPTLADQKWAAHSFGIGSWVYPTYGVNFSETEEQLEGQHLIYYADNSFTYIFKEWAQSSELGFFDMIPTNRSVDVTPTCVSYTIPKDKYGSTDSAFEITTKEGVGVTIDWLKDSGPGMTIFANPYWEGISPEYLSCGPRCSPVYIFQFIEGKDGNLYNCTVTISEVFNAVAAVHEMPDNVARIFAGSAGSEGWKDDAGRQFAKYSQGSAWGAVDYPTGDEIGISEAAFKVARFAAGSIADYDYVGPMVNATGMEKWHGVRLVVKWTNLYITLGMILAINLIFGIFIVIKANSVYCKDDSFLSTARLLRPLLEHLGDAGSHLTGRQIADTYDNKVTYGYRRNPHNNTFHLDFGDNIKPLPSGGRFPSGKYD